MYGSCACRVIVNRASLSHQSQLAIFTADAAAAAITFPFVLAAVGLQGLQYAVLYQLAAWITSWFPPTGMLRYLQIDDGAFVTHRLGHAGSAVTLYILRKHEGSHVHVHSDGGTYRCQPAVDALRSHNPLKYWLADAPRTGAGRRGWRRGQWRERHKQGIGCYQYPRGAKYEGEWRANVKDGFGIYNFPKGGLYKVCSSDPDRPSIQQLA